MSETLSIVCNHVFDDKRPVALVIHHSDGVWQLTCGKSDHPDSADSYEPVGLEHLLIRQPNLGLIADMPRNMIAEFDGLSWSISEYDVD